MEILHHANAIRQVVSAAKISGRRVGLVPTMGALHEGHLSLVDAALAECDQVAVSIFVNPTQFGPKEDLRKYPRPLDADIQLLEDRGCDWVFTPSSEEIYPDGFATTLSVAGVAQPFEGAARPGHFDGVATVVLKLMNIVPAQSVYFGEKDYQQSLVIRQLVRDLNLDLKLRVCPIIREPDGLAMSSRNFYLSPPEREQALALSKSLEAAVVAYDQGERDVEVISRKIEQILDDAGVKTEYATLVSEGTVDPVKTISGPTRALVAARVGQTRLIDNRLLAARSNGPA
ncbi:MAG: pantoate--beta-alanine ligase [Lacipirellulaceae bacterium]